jgi:hypothetical protein
MSGRFWAVGALVAALGAGLPGRAAAQQPVDSVRLHILESLQRLGRPAAPDTGAVDTTRVQPSSTGIGIQPNPRQRFAAPPPQPSTDSVIVALSKLPNYAATQYKGTGADYDAQAKQLVLYGDSVHKASVLRQGTELTADSVIRYDESSGQVRGSGKPVFRSPESDAVTSQAVVYDLNASRGSAFGARTRYAQGGPASTWYVHGDLPSVSTGMVWGDNVDFTSCDLVDDPDYFFHANHVKIVAGKVLVARPVTLYFGDVPVAWLPFFAQSLGSGRTSGLLTPRFSINDVVRRGGYHRRVSNIGFYWAMSDYTDATVAMDWFSGNFTSVTGSFQYRWLNQFANGSVNFREFWRNEGGTNWALDTNHDWKMDERTDARLSASIAGGHNSSDFIRRNSFDPIEVTQSINSQGGVQRRFGWGNLSLSGTRDQYLNDDRTVSSLPQLSMSLSPVTLFRAPTLRAKWYNNVTWNGNVSGRRDMTNYAPVDTTDLRTIADQERITGNASSSFRIGNLSWSQSLGLLRGAQLDYPRVLAVTADGRTLVATESGAAAPLVDTVLQNIAVTDLSWSTGLSYQQTLVGSTTFTPSLTLSGKQRRNDTLAIASDHFVSGPTKLTFGANFRSDLFRFFPGVGPFSAIRHKISPSIDVAYAPQTSSTADQVTVFGQDFVQANKTITLGLNQTFEAKRKPRTDTTRAGASSAAAPSVAPVPPLGGLPGQPYLPAGAAPGVGRDTLLASGISTAPVGGGFPSDGLKRAPRSEIVKLLTLNTSVVSYDFVKADTARIYGISRLAGFTTTQLQNTIGSDFLQGLSISMAHDLFEDSTGTDGRVARRRFSFHLHNLNLGFSLNNRSAIARGFGLFSRRNADSAAVVPIAQPRPPEDAGVQTSAVTNEATMIPRTDIRPGQLQMGGVQSGIRQAVGAWSANFSYSLVRPRLLAPVTTAAASGLAQTLNMSFTVKPTQRWDVSWRTSYDMERHAFNDHTLTLTRDIHDWDAHFDFSRTTTGNWYFRFDVALKANRDFKFDYRQHNNDVIQTPGGE